MELRACYFCGSPGSLKSYPVVPDRVDVDDADPDRVVLCPDCHVKLDRVLDGAFGALDAAPVAESVPDPEPDPTAADADGFTGEITFGDADAADPDDDPAAGDAPGTDSGTVDPGADGDTAETVDPGDDGDTAETTDDGPDADATETDADVDVVPDPSAPATDADTHTDADTEADGSAADASGSPAAAGTGTGTDGDVGADGEDGESDDAGEDGDGSTAASGTLRGLGNSGTGTYRQALRLLRNREFPMPRSDLVDVMSSAYDLSRTECDRLVDVAVGRGWLVDDDGVLRRE